MHIVYCVYYILTTMLCLIGVAYSLKLTEGLSVHKCKYR